MNAFLYTYAYTPTPANPCYIKHSAHAQRGYYITFQSTPSIWRIVEYRRVSPTPTRALVQEGRLTIPAIPRSTTTTTERCRQQQLYFIPAQSGWGGWLCTAMAVVKWCATRRRARIRDGRERTLIGWLVGLEGDTERDAVGFIYYHNNPCYFKVLVNSTHVVVRPKVCTFVYSQESPSLEDAT